MIGEKKQVISRIQIHPKIFDDETTSPHEEGKSHIQQ
jgi:hypothetical protein